MTDRQKQDIYAFDFDNTIYRGDSSLDFYLFNIRNKPLILRYLPYQLYHIVLYILRIESKTRCKSALFCFLRDINNLSKSVDHFWKKNEVKVQAWYTNRHRKNDIIVSASPDFLIKPIGKRLGVKEIIATRMDHHGIIDGENCHGTEKVKRLKTQGYIRFVEAYSDSMSDKPMLAMAKDSYYVVGSKRFRLEKYESLSLATKIWLKLISR